MQNFDPKMYNKEPPNSPPGVTSKRAVERGEHITDGETKRKKFSLSDEKKSAKEDPKEVKSETSPFALVGERKGRVQAKDGEPQEEVVGKDPKAKDRPFDAMVPGQIAAAPIDAEAVARPQKITMEDLMKELINSLTILKSKGQTETTVEIRHPPLFAGATLQLKAFDTAKGEFNITFSQLPPDAKALMDQPGVRESLLQNMAEKGFIVHILVATTEKDQTVAMDQTEESKKEQDERHEDQQPQEDR